MDPAARPDVPELSQLRERVDALSVRRRDAMERFALLPGSLNHRQLEAMRFELAEVEWRLAELEGSA